MRLNIQLFGGRGANSSSSRNSISILENGKKTKISWKDIKVGDTFEVEDKDGTTYTMKINSNYIGNLGERYTSGNNGKGQNAMTTLVRDEIYKRADITAKLYMTPLSKTKNWKRK